MKETIDATLNRISSSGVSGASYFSGGIINIARDAGMFLSLQYCVAYPLTTAKVPVELPSEHSSKYSADQQIKYTFHVP